MKFIYYEPTIKIKKNSIKYINPVETEVNFIKNIKIDKNKINLCCCLISFQPLNDKIISPNLSANIKSCNIVLTMILMIIFFFDKLLHLKKNIYFKLFK